MESLLKFLWLEGRNSMYSFWVIPVVALLCYIFLFISFLMSKKNPVIHSFMSLLLVMIAWAGGSLFMRLNYFPSVDFWFYLSFVGILLFTPTLFHFLKLFLDAKKNYHMNFWVCIIMIIWSINCFYPIFLEAPHYVTDSQGGAFVYTFTPWFYLLFVVVIGAFFEIVHMIYDESKKNKHVFKQLSSIFLGVGFLAFGNLAIIFPFFEGFPIDVFSGIPMAMCLFHALYKKRLFQLDLLISRVNCYLVSLILAVLIFSKLIPVYEKTLKTWLLLDEVQATLVISFTVMFATLIIYVMLHSFFDSLFGRTEIKHAEAIREFSEKVSHLMSYDEIFTQLIKFLKKALNVEDAYIFLKNEDNHFILKRGKYYDTDYDIPTEINAKQLLEKNHDCILVKDYKLTKDYQELAFEKKEALKQYKIECIAAIKGEDDYLGVILLPAKQSENYTMNDIRFLQSISLVASIAISNAKLYEQTYQEARRDYLTGVANRRYFFELLDLCRHEQRYKYGTIIMVSVDDFKLYNQLYGDEEGNQGLRDIARIIQETIANNGVVARYTGKVFAIMLPEHTVEQALQLAKDFSSKIYLLNAKTGENAMKSLTVSCGIASGVCSDGDFDQVIQHADTALYYAKQSGKNRIEIYQEGEHAQKTDELSYHKGIYSEYASTIYALTAAIDAKDHYTFSHSESVAFYAQELAKAYGMNEEGIQIVYEAGLLHDIGKIGIDEGILNKPGRLTNEEYEVMKRHVELSINIIRHLPSLDYVIPAVIGHHERYDGKGYPRGIKGEAIPLMARILCIADAFDAMISKRSYKAPMDLEDVLLILEKEAGHQFDPQLVPIFIKAIQEGRIEIKKY